MRPNPEAVMIEFLRTTPLWELLAGRIHAGPELPADYRPTQGAVILLSLRSGLADYAHTMMDAVIQFAIYGASAAQVREAESRLYEHLNGKTGHKIMMCMFGQSGGLAKTSEGGWWFSVSLYNCKLTNIS